MVLGLGAGEVELVLAKTDYKQGDSIEGRVNLRMKQSVKARGMLARFWAQRTEHRGKHSYVKILFEQSVPLDGEKEYSLGTTKYYTFAFTIPTSLLKSPSEGGGVFNGIKNFFINSQNNSITWFVEAKLDVPMAFDVSKKIQIRVSL